MQLVQLTGQLEALQQEHHRLTGSHMEQEKQNSLLQEECAQLQVLYIYYILTVLYMSSATGKALHVACYVLSCVFPYFYMSWPAHGLAHGLP